MYAGTPFDPLGAGSVDNFAFEFTSQAGAATIVSTSWTCGLDPYLPPADPTPQLRILSASIQRTIQVREPLTGRLFLLSGAFSVASVGGMPMSAIGSIYLVEATAYLSDGRVLQLSSWIPCAAPGTS